MKKRMLEGFTLIELLVVIATLGLLAAILFPVFAQVQVQARSKTGDKNIKTLAAGALQYVQDNDEKFPRSGYDCRGHNGTAMDDATAFAPGEHNQCGGDAWQDAIGPYVKDPALFVAPGDTSAPGEGPWGGGTGTNFNTTDGNFSYMYNDMLAHKMPANAKGYSDPSKQDPRSNGLRLTDLKKPSDCLLIAEGHGGWDKDGAPDDPGALTARDWTGSTDLQNKWHHEYSLDNFTPFLTSRAYDGTQFIRIGLPFNDHGGNVAFADGHVKFTTFSDAAGNPVLCKTLPWPKTIDPLQRNAKKDSCKDPDNKLPATWTSPNWF